MTIISGAFLAVGILLFVLGIVPSRDDKDKEMDARAIQIAFFLLVLALYAQP